jgi:hypothetical protein
MFHVQPLHDDQWSIVDDQDRQLFVGTKLECEDWLDAAENAARGPSLLQRLISRAKHFWRATPPHVDETDARQKASDPPSGELTATTVETGRESAERVAH